jgi:hypothetical protein
MRTLLRLAALPAVSLALGAQTYNAEYFKGDRKAIMAACADKARAIKPKDSRLLAEYGRAYLASGDRVKA